MSMLVQAAAVAVGGALGSLARWGVGVGLLARGQAGVGVGGSVGGSGFPIATLMVNVVGCVLIGAVMQVIASRPAGSIDPAVRAGVTAGLLGGLTTFSAFGFESFTLLREGRTGMALVVIGLNVGVGLAGVAMGWYGARWLVA